MATKLKEAEESTITKPHNSNWSIPESSWMVQIYQKLELERKDYYASNTFSIYRIPNYLDDGKSLTPQLVSIGPYHNSQKQLQPMERHKWRALFHMLSRTNIDFSIYFDAVLRIEKKIRSCYDSPIPLSSNRFVEMMTLDGVFILELLLGVKESFILLGYQSSDPICSLINKIKKDLMMLENQIPLLVLDTLYGVQLNFKETRGVAIELASWFMDSLMPYNNSLRGKYPKDGLHLLEIFCTALQELENTSPGNETSNPEQEQDPEHDQEPIFFKSSLIPRVKNLIPRVKNLIPRVKTLIPRVLNLIPFLKMQEYVDEVYLGDELIPSLNYLKQIGVKFKKKISSRFWDISFDGNTLSMPTLYIFNDTYSLLLNLVAFEQCHLNTGFRITSYVTFMDRLINSPDDFAELLHKEIIISYMGSNEEVTSIFNNISRRVIIGSPETDLSKLSRELKYFYNVYSNNWYINLKRKYFSQPWSIIAFIASSTALFLASTQTFYTVYQFYKQ